MHATPDQRHFPADTERADPNPVDVRLRLHDLVVGDRDRDSAGDLHSASGPVHTRRIADFDCGGDRFGVNWFPEIETMFEVRHKRGSARGLNGRDPGHAIDQPGRLQIHQRLAEGSSIPEIAAGKRNHIRRLPSELLQHFENDCLLTFDSEGID